MKSDPSQSKSAPARLLSIGAVARGSGLSEAVLRMWERRYGIPTPVRLPSGHRRYRPEQVRHMRLVAEALALGHKPGTVVQLPTDELLELIEAKRHGAPEKALVDALLHLDSERLRARMQLEEEQRGIIGMLDDFLAPLMTWVGTAWAQDVLSVRHEHLMTALAEEHLTLATARAAAPADDAPRFLLACLPEELHALGLSMAAAVCALHSVRVRFMGAALPIDQIVEGQRDSGAAVVLLSVPLSEKGAALYRSLSELRKALPDDVEVLAGGAGMRRVRRSPSGVTRLGSMAELDAWLVSRFGKRAS